MFIVKTIVMIFYKLKGDHLVIICNKTYNKILVI